MIAGALAWLSAGGPVMFALLAVGLVAAAAAARVALGLADDTSLLRALVAAAPLLGLLGTVVGIVTSLRALTGGESPEGLGGGIGTALRTTQYGLAIAIPGLFAERALDRLARRRGSEAP